MSTGSVWERFSHDPRHPDHAQLRAADQDRDIVHDVLGTAYGEGRLSSEELDQRTDAVTAARLLGELPELIGDLVPRTTTRPVAHHHRAEAERRYRAQRQQALMNFLVPTLICWAVWAATTAGFPWPVFVMIGTGMHFTRLVTNREDSIRSIERSLERKESKRLGSRRRSEPRFLPPPPGP
jgi:hypothetical protein